MIAGIVCEYNPFHKGHLYHIEKIRQNEADAVIAVMSGNFVQRGDCAFYDKWTRAEIAVRCGADLVIDLPTPWAMASAETFARGSIGLLLSFGIDFLSFGSEFDNKKALLKAAEVGRKEDTGSIIKNLISRGMSYPLALSKAAGEVYGKETEEILSSPNSTLAAEYINELKKQAPYMDFLPIKRIGAPHDSEAEEGEILSASKIRSLTEKGKDCTEFLPEEASRILKDKTPCLLKNNERGILSALRQMTKEEIRSCVTDENGLASRIFEFSRSCGSLEELFDKTKSKNFTHSRVRRETLNCFLKIDKSLCEGIPPYIKILAANEKGISLLKRAKESSPLPIITRHAEAEKLEGKAKLIYDLQCTWTDIFSLFSKEILPCGLEQKNSMIKIRR